MTSNVTQYRWFIFSLIAVALVYTSFSLFNMNQKMKTLEVENLSRGPVWYVTGVEFDTLRLNNTLLEYAHDQADGDDVRTTFDILWSRLAQMRRGATQDTLVNYDVDLTVYDSLMAALVANDSRVAALDMGAEDNAEALELAVFLKQFQDDLRASALEVQQASLFESNDVRVGVLGVARTVLYASLILSGAAILLFAVFALDSILARRALKAKKALLHKAYAADIAKSQFISVISHELRTPLTSISAALDLLKSSATPQTPEKFSRLIEIAKRNCASLRKLVDDLLETEKFASGKMKFDFQVVNLSEALHRTIESNQSYADSYGVEISANGIEPDVKITADPARVDQLMANLLSNAIKFSNKGGKVQIELTTEAGRAVVAVKDHGRGLPQKDKSRIFERFQQVDSSDKRERGGTGLGLSIVKAIAEAHHAKLTVESELGQGSTFYISFPITVDS
jgi:signal transduction histidine kinase